MAKKKQEQQKKKHDHAAKAVDVRSAYKASIEGVVTAAKLVYEYQCELSDIREFSTFWRDHLRWAKSTVYRLVDVGEHFGTTPPDTLAWFDLSALYLLAVKRVKPGVRKKAIKQAESGKFVSHADVKAWLGEKPANPANSARPGTINIDKAKLRTEAKKLKLDAGKVLELLEHLGVTVVFSATKPAKGEAA